MQPACVLSAVQLSCATAAPAWHIPPTAPHPTHVPRPTCGAGPAPADPLDELETKLGPAAAPIDASAGPASKPTSAREALAAGFAKLLGSAARREKEAQQWELKLSARGTPRAWADDSGARRAAGGRCGEPVHHSAAPV